MTDPSARTFSSDFKRFFLRGLVVLLPTLLTLWIVVAAYQFVDRNIAEPINQGVRLAMARLTPHWEPLRNAFDPEEGDVYAAMAAAGPKPPTREQMTATLRAQNINAWWTDHWYMNLIGLVVAIVGVYIAGRMLGGYIGRSIYHRLERLLVSVPVFKQVYPYIKQVVDFLFSDEKQMSFNRVVMVEYPRKGVWSLGFHTGGALKSIKEAAGETVTVFIPCAPTPFTGYVISVPRGDVIEVDITVEEAVRFVVSAGVVAPRGELADAGESAVGKAHSARRLVAARSAEAGEGEIETRG